MRAAPPPPDENARLEALRQTEVLDTEPEAAFDHLTRLAARLCGAPIALITLVDVDRQWFKSKVGVEIAETPRDVAFCAHTILERDLLVVPDALEDTRFFDNPLVTAEPKIRFYAGSPLRTHDDHAIGTLCVLDTVPHELEPKRAEALRTLARHVSAMLELRRAQALLKEKSQQWERAGEFGDEAARRESLGALGRNLRAMVRERERAEVALRELEQQLAELPGFEPEEQSHRQEIDDLLQAVVRRAEHLVSTLEPGGPSWDDARAIRTAAERARALLRLA